MRTQRDVADAAVELDRRRLLWHCRRGMKELDVLLERYARHLQRRTSAAERRSFARLLELPDPELAGYLFGHDVPGDPKLARLVRRIASRTAAMGEGS